MSFESELQDIIYWHTLNVCSKEEVSELTEAQAKKIYKGTILAIKSLISKYAPKEKQRDYAGSGGDKWMYEELNKEGFNLYRTELFREMGIK